MSIPRQKRNKAYLNDTCFAQRQKSGVGKTVFDIFILLALTPFMLLSLMAPGTMAMRGDNGEPEIVICSGYGPVTVIAKNDGSFRPVTTSPDHAKKSTSICDWAFHSHPASDMLVHIEPELTRSISPISISAAIAEHSSRIAVLCPSTRAPPISAFI